MIYYRRKKLDRFTMSRGQQRDMLGKGSFTAEQIQKMTDGADPNNIGFPDEVLNTFDQWLLDQCGFEEYYKLSYWIEMDLNEPVMNNPRAHALIRKLVLGDEQQEDVTIHAFHKFAHGILGNYGNVNTLILDDPIPFVVEKELRECGWKVRRV
jgi:hypothetical protein